MSSFSSNIYPKKNYKIDFYKQRRVCPNCGKHLSFHIEGNFGGALGIFSCKCGYRDSSIKNYIYATSKELAEFEKATEDIMW